MNSFNPNNMNANKNLLGDHETVDNINTKSLHDSSINVVVECVSLTLKKDKNIHNISIQLLVH